MTPSWDEFVAFLPITLALGLIATAPALWAISGGRTRVIALLGAAIFDVVGHRANSCVGRCCSGRLVVGGTICWRANSFGRQRHRLERHLLANFASKEQHSDLAEDTIHRCFQHRRRSVGCGVTFDSVN